MGTLLLVRHGQASFDKSDYDQLSSIGNEQARVLGAALRSRVPKVDLAVTGGMRRHRETADGCLAGMGQDPPRRDDPGFAEYDHEEVIVRYQPRYADKMAMMVDLLKTPEPRKAFQTMFSAAVTRWASGAHDADYRESWPVFRRRSLDAIERLVSNLGGSKTAMVFTSGGVIAAVAAALTGIPDASAFRLQWRLVNAGLTKLVYGRSGVHLGTLNDHAAFEGPRADLITYR